MIKVVNSMLCVFYHNNIKRRAERLLGSQGIMVATCVHQDSIEKQNQYDIDRERVIMRDRLT